MLSLISYIAISLEHQSVWSDMLLHSDTDNSDSGPTSLLLLL